jgi:DNA-binding NarL/FixJ family response regulator
LPFCGQPEKHRKQQKQGREEMILEMYKEGFSIQQIAKASKKSEQ